MFSKPIVECYDIQKSDFKLWLTQRSINQNDKAIVVTLDDSYVFDNVSYRVSNNLVQHTYIDALNRSSQIQTSIYEYTGSKPQLNNVIYFGFFEPDETFNIEIDSTNFNFDKLTNSLIIDKLHAEIELLDVYDSAYY